MRLLIRATLEAHAHEVLEAADGEEAWTLLWERRPALAVLDIQMPGRTGLEVAAAIRQDPVLRSMHVILLTAKAQQRDVMAGQQVGVDQYLTKPFLPSQLLAAITKGLHRSRP